MNADMHDFIIRVLKVTSEADDCDGLRWRVCDDGIVKFFVNCNDVFYWACADAEELNQSNIDVFEQAYADIRQSFPGAFVELAYAQELFCCRVRKMRPQGCCYPEDKSLWPLFDACGPERPEEFCNPYTPERYWAKRQQERIDRLQPTPKT